MSKTLIAPHAGREYLMVINRDKLIATINKKKQPAQYMFASKDIRLVVLHLDEDEIAITRQENARLLQLLESLLHPSSNIIAKSKEEKQRLIGRLYGYTEEEIDAFVASGNKCMCNHCNQEW